MSISTTMDEAAPNMRRPQPERLSAKQLSLARGEEGLWAPGSRLRAPGSRLQTRLGGQYQPDGRRGWKGRTRRAGARDTSRAPSGQGRGGPASRARAPRRRPRRRCRSPERRTRSRPAQFPWFELLPMMSRDTRFTHAPTLKVWNPNTLSVRKLATRTPPPCTWPVNVSVWPPTPRFWTHSLLSMLLNVNVPPPDLMMVTGTFGASRS